MVCCSSAVVLSGTQHSFHPILVAGCARRIVHTSWAPSTQEIRCSETFSRARRLLPAFCSSSVFLCTRRPACEDDAACATGNKDRVKGMLSTAEHNSAAATNHTLGNFGLFIL